MSESYEPDSDDEIASAAATYVFFSGKYLIQHFRDVSMKKPMTAEDLEFQEMMMMMKRKKRSFWVAPSYKNRERSSMSDVLTKFLKEPTGSYENLCRMSATDFECLLHKVGPHIARKDTNMRKSFPIHERLAATLRFLVTGDNYQSVSEVFKFSRQTVSKCVDDVCKALIQELQEEIALPKNADEWLGIAQGYQKHWNFPNCVGTIDSKLVLVGRPGHAVERELFKEGVEHIVLQALVDARYCFTHVDVISQEIVDGEILYNPSMFLNQECGQLKLPPDEPLQSCNKKVPYVFLVDSDCPSGHHKLKPYLGFLPKGSIQSVFNYRLSRARRVAENTFGILTSVFRILRKPLVLELEKSKNVILACVLLHNFLRRNSNAASLYTPLGTFDAEMDGNIIPGSWRIDQSEMTSFKSLKKMDVISEEGSEDIRKNFTEYFKISDKLHWQDKHS